MSLALITGQPFAVQLGRQWLAQKTTHALLLYGPDGVGKKTFALALAKELNPVGAAKVDSGNHPDVRVVDLAYQALVRGEDVAKQQNLRIETILKERHRLLQSPTEGPWKVLIIDDAHRLTMDAANALLKVLEEPPAMTAICLVTPFRERLLQTVISRCRPIRFRMLSDEERLVFRPAQSIQAISAAETLWESLPGRSAVDIVTDTEGRAKGAKITRTDVEEKIHFLRMPAARALRSGDPRGAHALPILEAALQALRANVQPGLVYENALLQLAKTGDNR